MITYNALIFPKDVKKIGFLGYGKSNKALLEYLRTKFDFEAIIRDEREILDCELTGARLFLGKHCFDPADEDVIFLSPSVRRERECVRALQRNGAKISSDAELFFSAKPKNVIAVTGSDGKSTTSALTGAILKESGKKSFVCGNFGLPMTPLLDFSDSYFVTELSSFTLNYLKPQLRRAIITNVTPNHLNWHASFEEYVRAKENVLENAKERVLCCDCEHSREFIKKYGAFALFSVQTPYSELRHSYSAEVFCTYENGYLLKNGEAILSRDKLLLPGMHNVKNALAAMCLTHGICDTGSALRAIERFRGLEHRCKMIYEFHGMRFYDSSIDSTPQRTKATLDSLDRTVTVVIGGKDKGLDYSPLGEALSRHAGAAILCGENAERIYDFLAHSDVCCPVVFAADYDEAVRLACGFGFDTVLSPASTSFDRFSNFEERGRAFLKAIKNICE